MAVVGLPWIPLVSGNNNNRTSLTAAATTSAATTTSATIAATTTNMATTTMATTTTSVAATTAAKTKATTTATTASTTTTINAAITIMATTTCTPATNNSTMAVPCLFCVPSLVATYYSTFASGDLSQTFVNPDGTWEDDRPDQYWEPYTTDGVESTGGPLTCLLCQYQSDPYFATHPPTVPPTLGGGYVAGYNLPMFGPCLSGAPSALMPCAQNVALFPPTFVGRYYYPLQKPNPEFNLLFSTPFPQHLFLSPGAQSSQTSLVTGVNPRNSPQTYGLGSQVAKASMAAFTIVNTTTNKIDTAATQSLMGVYGTAQTAVFGQSEAVQGWIKWTQHWCSAGCHRDSEYRIVQVALADYAGTPANSYLSRFRQPGAVNQVLVCHRCPPGQAGYNWNPNLVPVLADGVSEGPYPLALNAVAQNCYPWFGYLPVMVATPAEGGYGYDMQSVLISHGRDNVISPTAEYNVSGSACPVNTYSRECAHAKRWYYWQYILNRDYADDPAAAAGFLGQFNCTPCPAGGWHTNGSTGAWYCLPPPGMVMVNGVAPLTVLQPPGQSPQALPAWASRDLLQAEIECGYDPAHCLQCATWQTDQLPPNTLPRDFNELVIFSVLLETRPCQANFFCPDAFTEVACPSDRPYSLAGSAWNVSQCGCTRGNYLAAAAVSKNASGSSGSASSGSSAACTPCTAASACPTGYYLPTTCLDTDGMTADTPCRPCTNVPAVGATVLPARQYPSQYLVQSGLGVCSYQCNAGYRLVTPSAGGSCTANSTCSPVGVLYNQDQQPVWSAEAGNVFDMFIASNCGIGSPFNQALTNFLGVLTVSQGKEQAMAGYVLSAGMLSTGIWAPTTMRCLSCASGGASGGSSDTAAASSSCFNSRTPWYNISSDVSCVPCARQPPNGSAVDVGGGDVTAYAAVCSDVRCLDSLYYFNTTAWACQSCAARAAAICPRNRTQLRGGGCLGDYAPFNATVPSADCVACNKTFASIPPGFFLNYTAAGGVCAYQQCTPNPDPVETKYYLTAECGGATNNQWNLCNTEACPAGSYISALCSNVSDKVCTPCTAYKPGYYIVSPCSNYRTDSQWSPCTAGYTCDGHGGRQVCLAGKTSSAQAVPGGCYCVIGTVDDGSGGCKPFSCGGATNTGPVPGPGPAQGGGAHYVYLDVSAAGGAPNVTCLPCGYNGAYARGQGLWFSSCVCPLGYYGQVSTAAAATSLSSQQILTCVACPTSDTCNTGQMTMESCWKGDYRGSQAPGCGCGGVPPFAEGMGGAPCAFQCMNPFIVASAAAGAQSPSPAGVTGSSLYVSKARSMQGWTHFVQQPSASSSGIRGFGVKSFAVTSDLSDTSYLPGYGEQQYVVWIVDSLYVFYTQVPTASVSLDYVYATSYYTSNLWEPITSAASAGSTTYSSLVGVCVSQWRRQANNGTRIEQVTVAVVAQLVEEEGGGGGGLETLQLYTNSLDFRAQQWGGNAESGHYAFEATMITTYVSGLQYVSAAYSNVIPNVGGGYGDVFFVAYNAAKNGVVQCGGITYVAPQSPNKQFLAANTLAGVCGSASTDSKLIGENITGFTISTPTVDSFTMFVAFQDGSVYVVQLSSSGSSSSSSGGSSNQALVTEAVPRFVLLPAATTTTTASPSSSSSSSYFFTWLLALFTTQPVLVAVLGSPPSTATNQSSSASAATDNSAATTTTTAGALFAGDATELTMLPIEGLPWGAVASALGGAATGTSSGVLVASYGADIYAIDVGMCLPAAAAVGGGGSSIPFYWDGSDFGQQCVAQRCVHPACSANQHLVRGFQCQCNEGYYYSTQSQACTQCPTGSYCTGGELYSCPAYGGGSASTWNDQLGASSPFACTCSQNTGTYMQPNAGCTLCQRTYWCPNDWQAFACPGNFASGTNNAGNPLPTLCECAAGYTGPGCLPCPSGYICPTTTAASATVTNMAVTLGIAVSTTTTTTAESQTSAAGLAALTADLAAVVQDKLLLYFQTPSTGAPSYLQSQTSLSQRLYVSYLPATNYSAALLAVMLQVNSQADSNAVELWPATLLSELTAAGPSGATTTPSGAASFYLTGSVNPSNAQASTAAVPSNVPVKCQAPSSVPSSTQDTCICAAGYASSSSTTACTACAVNTFKSSTGPGSCSPCAVGLVSATAGGVNCTAPVAASPGSAGAPPASTTAAGGGGGISTPVLVACIAGGLVALGLAVAVVMVLMHHHGHGTKRQVIPSAVIGKDSNKAV